MSEPGREGRGEHVDARRLPPQHPEAERLVLGAVMRNPAAMEDLAGLLVPEDFYRPAHRRIWAAMLALYAGGEPIDFVSVSDTIGYEKLPEIGGIEYLTELVDATPAGLLPGHYAGIVKEKGLRRRLIHVTSTAAEACFDTDNEVFEVIAEAEKELLALVRDDDRQGYRRLDELLKESIRLIELQYKSNSEVSGYYTGFKDLDGKTNGLHPKDLIIVAGRPAMGKTAFTLNLAANVAEKNDVAVLVFSLEMGADQLARRMLMARAKVDGSKLAKGLIDAEAWHRLLLGADEMYQLPVFVDDDAALTVPMIQAKARRLAAQLRRQDPPRTLGLVVVDYLQLMGGQNRNESREQLISAISRGLKLLARELDVPVVALSQLNRGVESRPDKRPMISDLRESGAIEQDADIIMFLYRDVVYNPETPEPNVAELIIGKQRSGPTGTVKLVFHPQYTLFEDMALSHQVPDNEADYL